VATKRALLIEVGESSEYAAFSTKSSKSGTIGNCSNYCILPVKKTEKKSVVTANVVYW